MDRIIEFCLTIRLGGRLAVPQARASRPGAQREEEQRHSYCNVDNGRGIWRFRHERWMLDIVGQRNVTFID